MAGRRGARRAALLLALAAACAPIPEPAVQSPAPEPPAVPVSASPEPSPTPSPPRQWPDAASTGVPDGVALRPWTGDCTITRDGTVIDARLVECDLRIRAHDVVITRSRVLGSVLVRQPEQGYSFSISDSEVAVGERMVTAVGNGNFTLLRVDVTGGRRSVNCESDCIVEDSWIHAQAGDPDEAAHLSGIRMGARTVLRGNTIVCEGERIPPASGCSAAITGYGDFAPVEDNLVEGNLIQAGTASFCAFGGSTRDKEFSDEANHIRFIDNVFERGESGTCGIHAAIEAFDVDAPGNVWEDNVYDDGAPVLPRN